MGGEDRVEISGKTAIVTGGAAGIGQAAVLQLVGKGAARLIIVDVDEAGMAEAAARARAAGAIAETVRLDLSDLYAVETWFGSLSARGGCDILFNNAGIVSGTPQFPTAEVRGLRRMIDVNLSSLVIATQLAAQAMRARGGGVIVNTVSTVALGTGFSDALYATTKAGVMMFTRCCASLKADWNVRVAGVLPGLTNTPILKKTGADGDYAPWMAPILAGNAMCQPEDIADAVVDLIEDDTLAGGDWVAVRRIDGRIERQWGHDTAV